MAIESLALKDAALLNSDHPDIVMASDISYTAIAEREGYDLEIVHLLKLCAWITRPMRVNLAQQGYEFWPIGRELQRANRPHVYLRSDETSRGLIIVDAAWQQFIPRQKRGRVLPKVAVGTPDEVAQLAEDAGVKAKYLDYWQHPSSPRVTAEVDERFSFGLID